MVFSLGELLVEVFRKGLDIPFHTPGEFLGPYPSGAPAIFAHAISCLGYPTGLFATIGQDDFGRCLMDRVAQSGVQTKWITSLDSRTTGVAFTLFHQDGSREFIYHSTHSAVGQFGPEHLDHEALAKCEWLHLCGNVLGISESTRQASYEAAKIVYDNGGRISFDPNIRFEMMKQDEIWDLCGPVIEFADVLMPSGIEAGYLSGIDGEVKACKELRKKGTKIVALKRGQKGSMIFTNDGEFEVGSFSVDEVDPTGAGDCFDAGFVYGLLQNWDLNKCEVFANALGACRCTHRGCPRSS